MQPADKAVCSPFVPPPLPFAIQRSPPLPNALLLEDIIKIIIIIIIIMRFIMHWQQHACSAMWGHQRLHACVSESYNARTTYCFFELNVELSHHSSCMCEIVQARPP
jgi:hypothetical protein